MIARAVTGARLRRAAWFFVALSVALSGQATSETAEPQRVPTVTRLVQRFSALETGMHAAIRAGDRSTLERTLDEQFEMQVTAAQADVVARDAWIVRALAEPGAYAGNIGGFAVRDYGDIVLVSFDWQVHSPGKKHGGKTLFVTDSWRRHGDGWRLALRIVGPAKEPDAVIPGWQEGSFVDKRY